MSIGSNRANKFTRSHAHSAHIKDRDERPALSSLTAGPVEQLITFRTIFSAWRSVENQKEATHSTQPSVWRPIGRRKLKTITDRYLFVGWLLFTVADMLERSSIAVAALYPLKWVRLTKWPAGEKANLKRMKMLCNCVTSQRDTWIHPPSTEAPTEHEG